MDPHLSPEAILMQAADNEAAISSGRIGQPITYEKIPTHIYADSKAASAAVAQEIADLIRQKQKENKSCVLGLATGSSPKTVYAELVRMHREEGLSFKNVISFNLDEYHPMEPDSIHSYYRFMKEQLFDLVDMPKDNYFLPDGTIPISLLQDHCQAYESKINALGGLDFQLLGIGGNGHVGFNEPGSLYPRCGCYGVWLTVASTTQGDYHGYCAHPERPTHCATGLG
jgi:glucosamine-6-phosphate deaminase